MFFNIEECVTLEPLKVNRDMAVPEVALDEVLKYCCAIAKDTVPATLSDVPADPEVQ